MSETIILALIGLAGACVVAIPPTLVAWAGLRQGRINSAKSDKIHELANSTLSKSQALYDVAMSDIVGLKALIAEMNKEKAAGELQRERIAKEVAQAQIPLLPKSSL